MAWTRKEGATVAVAMLRSGAARWRVHDDLVTDSDTREVQIAVGDDGDAAAVWLRGEGGDKVRAALPPAEEEWQPSAELTPAAVTADASGAEVDAVIDRRGNAVAVWSREMQVRGRRVSVVQSASHGPL